LDNKIEFVKERIRTWLVDERFSPEEIKDDHSFYIFKINVYGTIMFVGHSTQFTDSISASASFDLTGEKDQRLLASMDERRRAEFVRDLAITMLSNNAIWYHLIRPSPPKEMRSFELASRRIYYDTLTKEKLMNAILDVRNASGIFTCLFERYAQGVFPRQEIRAPSFIG
jgi:hypothetical protein